MNDVFGIYCEGIYWSSSMTYQFTVKIGMIIYLITILGTLMKNQLFVNQSKCLIGKLEVENLGHIISATRVSADPKKIHSMETQPIPSNTTALRGFLGLSGYYQKLIQRYGGIAAP